MERDNEQYEDAQIEYSPSKEEIIEYAKYLGMDLEKDHKYLHIAEEGLRASLPDGWKEYITPEGEIYYFNQFTQMSQWEHPSDEFYKGKFMQEKSKEQQNHKLMQDFVENDIIVEQKAKKSQYSQPRNSPQLIQLENKVEAQNQVTILTPISVTSQSRQTPKQEYYDYNQEDGQDNFNHINQQLELKQQIANIEIEFESKKNQLKLQFDLSLQQFLKQMEDQYTNNQQESKDDNGDDSSEQQIEKEQLLKQIQINFNEQKIIQENKLISQFNDIKQQIQNNTESKYKQQLDKLNEERREYDDLNQNKSFLSISQKSINSALLQEQQKMKQYYEEQIQHLKNQGLENQKYAIQDYKNNLNFQLHQKRQQRLREMKEKIDISNEQKKDRIRKELLIEFEQKKYDLKKQYIVEENTFEQQERIKIETEYSSEISKLELKYMEDLNKLKQSEEIYYVRKQDRLQKISLEIQAKYDAQEKEIIINQERKIQKLEDEMLDMQSKVNTKKIYSKKYLELKKLEDQLIIETEQQRNQYKYHQAQLDQEKANMLSIQNQIQERLQVYQKLVSESNQYNFMNAQQQHNQEIREQLLVEKVNKIKDEYLSIQKQIVPSPPPPPQQPANNNPIHENILKRHDTNVVKKTNTPPPPPPPQHPIKYNQEDDENQVLVKEKEQLKNLKKMIEMKLVEINKNQLENQNMNRQNSNAKEDGTMTRKKLSLIDNPQPYKRHVSCDRVQQSQSQQGFYQDHKRSTPSNNNLSFTDKQSKEDQISQLKFQLEQIKNQVQLNEQRKMNSQQPKISKKRELSLEDFTNKRIVTPSHQGNISFNKFGDSSRQNSHNQSVQSSKLANYTFMQQSLRKDWKTIISLEFEKLKLEVEGLKKDKQLLTHQTQLTKDEIKNLRKGQNEFLLHSDISKNLQNTVKNAEKVLKEKLLRLDNEKIVNQRKELEINQKKRILDNMQIKLDTMSNADEEDDLETLYEEYRQIQNEDQRYQFTSINNYYNENDQSISNQIQKRREIESSYRQQKKYVSLQPKMTYQHGNDYDDEFNEQDEGESQSSVFEDNNSIFEDNDSDNKKYHISQQRSINNRYHSLQIDKKFNKINQQAYIQGYMKPYSDLLSKYTLN